AGGELAGQWPDGLAQLPQLAGVGVEDVELIELPVAVELGGLPGSAGGSQPMADLLGDEAAEVVDARLQLLTVEGLVTWLRAGGRLEQPVEVELPHDAVQVVPLGGLALSLHAPVLA